MIIDIETFTEISVHLKVASDALLSTARTLAVLCNTDPDQTPDHQTLWDTTLKGLTALNTEVGVLEQFFRAILIANAEERSPTA